MNYCYFRAANDNWAISERKENPTDLRNATIGLASGAKLHFEMYALAGRRIYAAIYHPFKSKRGRKYRALYS